MDKREYKLEEKKYYDLLKHKNISYEKLLKLCASLLEGNDKLGNLNKELFEELKLAETTLNAFSCETKNNTGNLRGAFFELMAEVRCTIKNSILAGIKLQKTSHAKKANKAKLINDPKQKEKAIVRECWEAWQKQPKQYKNDTKFAQAMLDKFRPEDPKEEDEHLNSVAVITGWCRNWRKEKSQSAS